MAEYFFISFVEGILVTVFFLIILVLMALLATWLWR
jgi:hypothetical protein